jgi:hypothetical protein
MVCKISAIFIDKETQIRYTCITPRWNAMTFAGLSVTERNGAATPICLKSAATVSSSRA